MSRTRFVALLVLTMPAAALSQDRIVQKDGKTIPGPGASQRIEVTEETIQQVTYTIAGVPTPQAVAASRVERVEYAKPSPEYNQGLQAMKKGEYEEAVEHLTKAAEAHDPSWAKPYALFKIGQAYQASGEFERAVEAYNKLISALPRSRFVPEAKLNIAVTQFRKGDVSGARTALRTFKEEAASKGYAEEWANWATYWEIRLLENEKNYDEALTRYGALAAKVEKDTPRLANECRLRIGGCHALKGDFTKAFDFYKAIVETKEEGNPDLLAGARLGMGLSYFNQKNYVAARWEFLRAVVLSDQNPTAVNADTAAAALLYAGQCFELLKENEPDGPVRAQKLFRECTRTYPGTVAAVEAKKRIK
jgi:TolA-binding protein